MNNLKITYRSLNRNRFYTGINVIGLSIGMAAAILLLVWIYHEWSFDRFHAKEKQLYQVWSRVQHDGPVECWNRTSMPLGPALKSDYPDIAEMTRFRTRAELCTVGDNRLTVQTACVDPGFLTMFNFPLLHGNSGSGLNDLYSIILTEKTAKRLFGDEDPMGKSVLLDNTHPVTVMGVMKNIPNNTTFEFEALLPFAYGEKYHYYPTQWGNHTFPTYVELQPLARVDQVNRAICNIFTEHNNKLETETFLFPLSKSHLYTKSENGILTGGLIDTLRLFGLVALLILLIACINFMNLSTARGEKRAKEVGVRKVMGSKRISLIRQFLGESTMLVFIAGVVAVLIVELALPAYSNLMGKTLTLDLTNGWFWLLGLAFILFTGLLAGSYPAFHLSSFLPVKVLKGTFREDRRLIAPRKVLVVVQFIVAVFLVSATLVIHRQVHYAQDRDNGYNKDHLVYQAMTGEISKNYELVKHDLLSSGAATSVTRTFAPMTEQWADASGVSWRGSEPDDKTSIDIFFADTDWAKTVGTTIIRGRDVDMVNWPTDSTAALLNEAAVKKMGFDDPIGESVEFWGGKVHVVGVIKDFILHSPYEPTKPMIIAGPGVGWFNTIHIRLNGANKTADNLAKAETIFKKYNPAYPFEYNFIDTEYARKFQDEKTMGSLATWFTILTIFISCMGLFALVAYMVETRTKEIGIRKVLGASVKDITSLLSKEFLLLVLVAIVIALPVAWWVMDKWLGNYAYHTDIPWWLFAVVALSSLLIALLTVGFQAVKAATANPVKAIKSE